MFGKNLKITTKLTIATAVFLVPLTVMFYLLISVLFDSINRYKNEMKELACLRPAVSLIGALTKKTLACHLRAGSPTTGIFC